MAKFQAPMTDQVKEVLRRIPTPQLRRAFFEGLRNPLWVEPLAKEGAFKHPPEPERTDDGLIRDIYWPEIDYLIRMAPEVPGAVVDVLLKLGKSNNAWVRRGVFTIGASIEAGQAVRLRPLIQSWASSGFGWRTDPREMVGMAVNLLSGGQYEVGKWFANILFKPSRAKGRQKPNSVLEDYWYEESLPKIVAVLGEDGLGLVLPWLVAFERQSGHLKRGTDWTSINRDAIRARSDSYHSVEQVLIDAVRDLALKAVTPDPSGARSLLLSAKMLLARKVALYAFAEALTQNAGKGPGGADMLRVAHELLFDPASFEDACRVEYGELARSVAALTAGPLEPLTELLNPSQHINEARLRQWLGRDESNDSVVDERVKANHERWMHRWLATIGTDALPAPLRTRLADLDARLGVIESPLEAHERITSWTGPNSPLSQDDMSIMSPTELVAHLESWRDTGDGWGPEPSHEGQGRQLAELLTTNPNSVAGVDDLVERLRPTYLRAILRGWDGALKADLELDWSQVERVIRGVLMHDDKSTFPVEGGQFDDDVDFRWAKRAAVDLLEELAKKRSGNVIPSEAAATFSDMLITVADDEVAWTEYASYEAEDDTDPLTVSLNWQWPVRVRGLVYLVSHGEDSGWFGAARAALERELTREDTRCASRAVLGEGLGRLLAADEVWVEQMAPAWFGSELESSAGQQIALTTAMAVHYYHRALYDLLSPAMLGAINSETPIVVGWRSLSDPLQRIGEWVAEAIIRGDKTLDDSVAEAFFSHAPAKVRGEAIGHIAWSFMHAEIVENAILDRLATLWDSRVQHVRSNLGDREELSGFCWFVRSGKFDANWWLPRLKEAAELNPSLSGGRYMIGKEVASAADVDARGAFDVLRLLLEGRDEAGMAAYDLTRNAVPMVLARAIASGDDQLTREATAYMHKLGEQGNLQLETEVKAVLDGKVGQDDVDD